MSDAAGEHLHHSRIQAFRRTLLAWYDRCGRDLPWRIKAEADCDAYSVLVSELMLQQTQVATVKPYFRRFMTAFPTIQSLAQADEQAVLRLWQGLGYYRRAKHLHAAARRIVVDHDGRLPETVDELITLPGIGRYTAGAVASIAFGQRAAAVDGNVMRVLARWLGVDEPVDTPAGQRRLWDAAQAMVSPDRPGDYNQALMELGALICVGRTPNCAACPVSRGCAAKKAGNVADLPRKSPRKAPMAVRHVILAVHRDGQYLFEKRGERGLWAGLWQLPTVENVMTCGNEKQIINWVRERFALKITEPRRLVEFDHRTTHRAISFEVWDAEVDGGRKRQGVGVWRTLDAIDDLPLANPQRRAIDLLGRVGIAHHEYP